MIEIGQGRIEGTKKNIEKAKKDVKDFKKKILKVQNDAKTAGRNRDKAIDAMKAIEVKIFFIFPFWAFQAILGLNFVLEWCINESLWRHDKRKTRCYVSHKGILAQILVPVI